MKRDAGKLKSCVLDFKTAVLTLLVSILNTLSFLYIPFPLADQSWMLATLLRSIPSCFMWYWMWRSRGRTSKKTWRRHGSSSPVKTSAPMCYSPATRSIKMHLLLLVLLGHWGKLAHIFNLQHAVYHPGGGRLCGTQWQILFTEIALQGSDSITFV